MKPTSRLLLAVAAGALASSAMAQTTAGTSTTIVVPVIAQTVSYTSEITVFNPNGTAIGVSVLYYDANNLATAGPKTCTPLNVPANTSVQFALPGQCTLEANVTHYGLLVLSEQSQSLEFHGYVRTQNPQGIGFSTEGFPIEHFSDAVSHATGLKRLAAAAGLPPYQSNCFVASLGQAVSYQLRLVDGTTNVQIGSTLAGSLGPYEQLRYLDIFSPFPNGVGAPGGDYSNVRAQFTNLTGNDVPLIGFCTVQDNQSFAADFRIAKSYAASVNLPADVFVQNGNAFGTTAILGTNDDFPLDIRVNGARVMRYEPNATSPNVVGGHFTNSTADGVYGATIAGGGREGTDCYEPASGTNTRSCANLATEPFATSGGGHANQAGGSYATVAGGNSNSALDEHATVGGGEGNIAGGSHTTIGGGFLNSSYAGDSTIAGGYQNTANGSLSTIGGGRENATSGTAGTVGGGYLNTASNNNSTVAGGRENTASGTAGAVGGGFLNTATNNYSVVAGGRENTASGEWGTVGGGDGNAASGHRSIVSGGFNNIASGYNSTVGGGFSNTASGDFSFAAGRRAKTQTADTTPVTHYGAFVWADSRDFDFNSTGANEFAARATGGVRFVTSIDGSGNPVNSVRFDTNGNVIATGAFNPVSDVNMKTAFSELAVRDVLNRVLSMPVRSWAYKSSPAVRHIGPTAQDFHAAFGVGIDDKHIATVDADGVALAAIQGLHQLVQKKDRQIAQQARELVAVAGEVAELRRLVDVLLARTAPDANIAQAR